MRTSISITVAFTALHSLGCGSSAGGSSVGDPTGTGGHPNSGSSGISGSAASSASEGGLLIVADSGGTGAGAGTSSVGTSNENAAAQCNGLFTGYLLDFTTAQAMAPAVKGPPPWPAGVGPLNVTATPPIAEIVGGVTYSDSPDFEVANCFLHPATCAGKAYKADPGIVQATLGVDKTPVYAGAAAGTATTTGAAAFQTWFHDAAVINLGKNLQLQFVPDPANPTDPNAYYYDSATMGCGASACSGFYPIDGAQLGDEGNIHNYHMTFQLHLQFKYHAGQLFNFKGDDDVWVFVNNHLAVDLGGIHQEAPAVLDVTSLGLTDGQTYPLDFFWAERHVKSSNFYVETSLQVTNCGGSVVK